MSINTELIGRGIIFPFSIDSHGRVPTISNLNLVKASIIQIMSWPKGLKFFNESFGSRLDELLEEPNDDITKTLIESFITDAIGTYETRVKLLRIEVIPTLNRSKYNIEIKYRLKNSNIIDSFIQPFYTEIKF